MRIISKVDKEFAMKVRVEQVVLEIIRVAQVDDQVAGVYNGHDLVYEITEVNNRLDIYKIINLL